MTVSLLHLRDTKLNILKTLRRHPGRSSHPKYTIKKGALKNFAKFTGKEACNFIKKETLGQVFSCEFCEILKNTIFTEHLRAIGSILDVLWTLHICSIYTLYPGDTDRHREYADQIKCHFTAQKMKFSINNLITLYWRNTLWEHCMKSVQIRSIFWSVFSCIQSEYRKIQTRKYSVFVHFSCSGNFTYCAVFLMSQKFIYVDVFVHDLCRTQANI